MNNYLVNDWFGLLLEPYPSHHDLLCLHVVAVDEANHVNSRGSVDGLADAAVDGLTAEDATVEVNHLQGGTTFVADDPATVVVKCKGP